MRILFIVALACTIWTCSAQVLNERYIFDRPSVVYSGVLIKDSTIFVSGITASDLPPQYLAKTYLSVFDLGNNNLRNHFYHHNDTTFIGTWRNNLIETMDGYFVNVGYTADGNVGFDKALLFKHDDSLNIQFFKEYEKPVQINDFALFDVLETPTGFICLGNYYYEPNGFTNIVLLKTDSAGNELDRIVHGTSQKMEFARTFVWVSEGYYFVAGYKGIPLGSLSQLETANYFLKVDDDLNVLDVQTDSDTSGYGVYAIIESSDSTVTYCGSYATGVVNQGGGYYTFSISGYIRTILKNDYSPVWDLVLGPSYTFTHFNEIKQLPDKSFIAVGESAGYGNVVYNTNGDADTAHAGWILKVSPTGQLLWERLYAGIVTTANEINYLSDFEILPNGDIIACGESTSNLNGDPHPQQGWLLRVDSFGCLVPGCQLVGIEEPEPEAEIEFIKIFPNPADDWLYIYFASPQPLSGGEGQKGFALEIYNVTGMLLKRVDHLSNHTTYMLELDDWASGVYFVALKRGNEILQTEQLVKQ
jgi:hypothetical protein